MSQKNIYTAIKITAVIMILILLMVILIAIIFLNFGNFSGNLDSSKKVVDSFYSKLNDNDYNAILPMLHGDWFKNQDEEQTIKFLENNQKLGSVENYSLLQYTVVSDLKEGNFISMVYDVKRTNSHTEESFSIVQQKNSNTYLIRGYHISVKS